MDCKRPSRYRSRRTLQRRGPREISVAAEANGPRLRGAVVLPHPIRRPFVASTAVHVQRLQCTVQLSFALPALSRREYVPAEHAKHVAKPSFGMKNPA